MNAEHTELRDKLVEPLGQVSPQPTPEESAMVRLAIADAALLPMRENTAELGDVGPLALEQLAQIEALMAELYDALEAAVDEVSIIENLGAQEFVDSHGGKLP